MRLTRRLFATVVLSAAATPIWAQIAPPGSIAGRVIDPTGLPLAGVTVTARRSGAAEARRAIAVPGGEYRIADLPAGEYQITFELQGFHTERRTVRVAADAGTSLDVTLNVEAIPETIRVTSNAVTAEAQRSELVGPTLKADSLELLAIGPLFEHRVTLAPGVTTNGPDGAVTISGAMSYGNLFLVDGFVVNENLRGYARPFVQPDAMQETRLSTTNIPIEYGRFQGGVVNSVTKSGGDRFSGTLRSSFFNDAWRALTPHPRDARLNRNAPGFDAALGGPIVRGRTTFFAAVQIDRSDQNRTLPYTGVNYAARDRQRRYQAKLDWTPWAGQTVKLGYFGVQAERENASIGTVMDLASLYDSRTPEALVGATYSALFGSRWLVDVQYSNRQMKLAASGATRVDQTGGTPIWDRSRSDARFASPTGCAVCPDADEERDNQNAVAKLWYVLPTSRFGVHELLAGIDLFQEARQANAYQSGSGFRVRATRSIISGDQAFPVFLADRTTWIYWTPVVSGSRGNDLRTYSAFLSDTWRPADRLTVRFGLRLDRTEDRDSLGARVIHGDSFSPRLSVAWDPFRNGQWRLSAGAARYVMANNTAIVDAASPGGRPATYVYDYLGPAVNSTTTAQPASSNEALKVLFDWFNANGGTSRATRSAPSVPGVNPRIDSGLSPPDAAEFTLGVTRMLGSRGSVRVEGVYRTFGNLYGNRRDLSTGRVTDANGTRYDLLLITNAPEARRRYVAVNSQLTFRPTARAQVVATYTWSRTRGNSDGESTTIGPDAASLGDYPEYRQARWNAPEGWLSIDQRHKLRGWATWSVPLPATLGSLVAGVVQRVDSGRSWSAVANINPTAYVANPGYVTPPTSVAYYFSARGQFRLKTITETDLSLTWSRAVPGARRVQVFARALLVNAFNQAGIDGVGRSVLTRNDSTALAAFNPFTDTPVRGVNYEYGQDFGKPTSPSDYQAPRQFSLSIGARF